MKFAIHAFLTAFFSFCTATYCYSTNSLRLYNPYGSTATQGGMLQICISNQWTAVCDYSFSCSVQGKIACRQLGFSGSQISEFKLFIFYFEYSLRLESYVLTNSAQYFGRWSYTDSRYYSCSSSSYSSLTSCSTNIRPHSSDCDLDDQVGLWCATFPSSGTIMHYNLKGYSL